MTEFRGNISVRLDLPDLNVTNGETIWMVWKEINSNSSNLETYNRSLRTVGITYELVSYLDASRKVTNFILFKKS